MSRYEVGFASVAAAAAAAYQEIRATATKPLQILELGFFCNAATASSVGFGRPATAGTATGATTVQADRSGDATGTATTASTWSAAPTAPTVFHRRIVLPASIGAGVIWQWPPGVLTIPVSGSMVLWNFGGAAGSVLNGYFVVDEV